MTRIEYNGGPDFYVGLSTEPKPTHAADGISEGACIYFRDTQTVVTFSGDDSDDSPWSEVFSF